MYEKYCPYCGCFSYSAARHARWECPYCHRDITWVEAVVAGAGSKGAGKKPVVMAETEEPELMGRVSHRPPGKGKVLTLRSRC